MCNGRSPSKFIRFGTYRLGGSPNLSFPRSDLIVISHALAEDRYSSSLPVASNCWALSFSFSGSLKLQRKIAVSSRYLTFSSICAAAPTQGILPEYRRAKEHQSHRRSRCDPGQSPAFASYSWVQLALIGLPAPPPSRL